MSRLHTLNIANNKITDLKTDFFKSQEISLKWLDISFNNLHSMPTSLMKLNKFQFLYLRFNIFTYFIQKEMIFLQRQENLLVKIEGNMF